MRNSFRSSRRRDCPFMTIKDAIVSHQHHINLVGVAVETSFPKPTKGSDFFRSVKIVDESTPDIGFYLHFFAETIDKLPHAQFVGDIIVVYNVVVTEWEKGVYGVYGLYNKRFSSFALFTRRVGGGQGLEPYQVSSTYDPRPDDDRLILKLMDWPIDHIFQGLSTVPSFKEIKEDDKLNLLCKILHVHEIDENERMFLLWDGSDTPPVSIETKLEDEMDHPLPLQLESSVLSREVLCTLPPVGTVLRMFVDKDFYKPCIKFLTPNRWVKFAAIKCEIQDGLWDVILMQYTKLSYLPEGVDCVMERERCYKKRISSKWGRVPISSLPTSSAVTETDHPQVPFSSLMDVITHPEVTYKFKCVVRVVATLPWSAKDFRAPNGVYRVRLNLEDPTARIHAYLYAEDGAKFFGNFSSLDALTKMRNMLLGIADDGEDGDGTAKGRNPPWIQCCLKSFYISKNDVWGSRKYRIFATKMIGC